MGFTYRHCGVPDDWIFTEALVPGHARRSRRRSSRQMDEVAAYREKNQPIKERTGGSTFKNPPGNSAWKLIDAAGCRGLRVGGAKVSEMHCNFLINDAERHRRGYRAAWRDGARAREGDERHRAANGRSCASAHDRWPRPAPIGCEAPCARRQARMTHEGHERASRKSPTSPC